MIIPGVFFLLLGALCIVASRAVGENSRLIAEAMSGRSELKEGHRVAVLGTIEAATAPMLSPARNLPCVIYAYKVEDANGETKFHGQGMVPCFIASGIRKIPLQEFPVLGHFEPETAEDRDRAANQIGQRAAASVHSLTPALIRPGRENLSSGKPWAFDARAGGTAFDAATMTTWEQIVPAGHRVIALGIYSAAGLERIQLLNDEREVAFERTGRQRKFWRNIGLIGILMAIAFFVGEMVS
jgi:hypothetical protein